jgi:dTDP-glucose 4,6-dehydratase
VLAVAGSDLAGPVNVGSPDEMTILRIAKEIVAATGSRSEIHFVELPVDDPLVRRPDTTLIERELGWRPQVSWDEGIRRTIAAVLDQGRITGFR